MHGLENQTAQKLDVQCYWKPPSLWKYCSYVFLFDSSSGKWDGTKIHASWWKKRVEALSRTTCVKTCHFQIMKLLNILTFSSRAYQQAGMFYFVKWKYQRNIFQSIETTWSVLHVPLLKQKCTWPGFTVWSHHVCPLSDNALVLCPRGSSLWICWLVGQKLALLV